MPKKTCGELVLTSGLILLKYQQLIPDIMNENSPNSAYNLILGSNPVKLSGRKLNELARAAQALRAILRDYPEEIENLERQFGIQFLLK